jgi:hypothetical protein
MYKWNYFRKLLINAVPSAIAIGGALVAYAAWLKSLFLVFAVIAYILVSYFQAGTMADNDKVQQKIGASVEGFRQDGFVIKSISVNGKPVKSKKK